MKYLILSVMSFFLFNCSCQFEYSSKDNQSTLSNITITNLEAAPEIEILTKYIIEYKTPSGVIKYFTNYNGVSFWSDGEERIYLDNGLIIKMSMVPIICEKIRVTNYK